MFSFLLTSPFPFVGFDTYHRGSVLLIASVSTGGQVWIVGHSFVFWAERHPLAKRASELLGGRVVWCPRSTLVSLLEFGVGAGANLGVVVHLGGNDLGQLKGRELILWIMADL